MRNPVTRWSFLAIAAFGIFAAVISLTANFTFSHPQAPDVRFTVKSNGRIALADAERYRDKTSKAHVIDVPRPKAVVQKDVHDFDIMNPDADGKHVFQVFNAGTAPLTLTLEKTSCGCTNAEILDSVIDPGSTGLVSLSWHTDEGPLFEEGVWIQTNDSRNKRLELIIQGKIAARILSNRRIIRFPGIEPGQSATEEFFFYSGVWDDFNVTSVRPNIEGFTHTVEKVTDESTLAELEAKSAYRIELTSPADIEQGEFRGLVYVKVEPLFPVTTGEEKVAVQFAGERLGQVGLYGEGVSPSGYIDLGHVSVGRAINRRLVLRVRGAEISAEQIQITSTAGEVDIRLDASPTTAGLFYVNLSVPKTTKACAHLSNNPARISIRFDDPKLKPVNLFLLFAVVQP